MARLNMRQSATPSHVPAWTPNPMIRREYWPSWARLVWKLPLLSKYNWIGYLTYKKIKIIISPSLSRCPESKSI